MSIFRKEVKVFKTIKNKFHVEQVVFILAYGEIKELEIESINININKYSCNVSYNAKISPYGSGRKVVGFDESELFETKEDLCNDLINK